MLLNGTIQHGTQIFSPSLTRPPPPTTPATPASASRWPLLRRPPPQYRRRRPRRRNPRRLRQTRRPHPLLRDQPRVRPIARNLFTYLRDSPAQITLVEGDARASLAQKPATLRRARRRCLLRRRHPPAPPYHRGHGPLPAPPCAQRHPGLSRLQPVPRPRPQIALLAASAHLHSVLMDSHAADQPRERRVQMGPGHRQPDLLVSPRTHRRPPPSTPSPASPLDRRLLQPPAHPQTRQPLNAGQIVAQSRHFAVALTWVPRYFPYPSYQS